MKTHREEMPYDRSDASTSHGPLRIARKHKQLEEAGRLLPQSCSRNVAS